MVFEYSFMVDAPLEAVTAFHSRMDILRKLTPPPIFIQVKSFGEMVEGMEAHFVMWLGPIPMRWHVRHINVSERGFTDVQLAGPMRRWEHTHRFTAEGNQTRIDEHIEYEHPAGIRGIGTRLLFNRMGLVVLFSYRRLVTRRFLVKWNRG